MTAAEYWDAQAAAFDDEPDHAGLADPDLWGGPITDERYLVVGRR